MPSAVLTAAGYRVLTAADGNEAIRIILAEPVDLLFTDIIMPGMNGYELACAAKSIRPELRVLYTSGFPGWTHRRPPPRAPTPWRNRGARDQLVSEIDHALVGSNSRHAGV